jgi:hypothetical protein
MWGTTSRGSSRPARMLRVRRSRIALHRVEVLGERAHLSRANSSAGEECSVERKVTAHRMSFRCLLLPRGPKGAGMGAGRARRRREGWRSRRRRGNQPFMYAITTENVARKDEERSFLAQRSGTTRLSSPPLVLFLRAASSSSRPRSCRGNRKTAPSCLPAPPHTVSCTSPYPVSALATSPPASSYLPGEVEAAAAPGVDFLFVIGASGSLLLDGDCWEAGSLDLLLALLRSESRRGRTACTLAECPPAAMPKPVVGSEGHKRQRFENLMFSF